jgi:hypothetical protein
MGDEFDVEEISMLSYAEDLEIAPLDLMIVVCEAALLTLDCSLLTVLPRTFISRRTYYGVAFTSLGPQSPRRTSSWYRPQQPPRRLLS